MKYKGIYGVSNFSQKNAHYDLSGAITHRRPPRLLTAQSVNPSKFGEFSRPPGHKGSVTLSQWLSARPVCRLLCSSMIMNPDLSRHHPFIESQASWYAARGTSWKKMFQTGWRKWFALMVNWAREVCTTPPKILGWSRQPISKSEHLNEKLALDCDAWRAQVSCCTTSKLCNMEQWL